MAKLSAIQSNMQDLQALAEYVQQHLQRPGVSTHTIAQNAGGGISHGTVWNIANQHVNEVKERTLVALARGLGVSFEEVQAVVKGKPPQYVDPFESIKILFHGWEGAPETDRKAVMEALKLIGEGFQQRILHRRLKGGSSAGKHSVREVAPGKERNNNLTAKKR